MELAYRKDALIVFLFLAFVFAYFYHDSGGNGNSRFALVFAVANDGRLEIDSYIDSPDMHTDDKAQYHFHFYSDKAIGTALLAELIYAPLLGLTRSSTFQLSLVQTKYLLTVFTVGIPSAFAGSLIYVLCKYISRSRLRALVVTFAITLGTIAFPFSLVFFEHQLASALLFTGFFLLFQLKVKPALHKLWYLALIGFILAYAVITSYPTAVIVLGLGLYYLYILVRQQPPGKKKFPPLIDLLIPVLGGLVPLLLMMGYNTTQPEVSRGG